MKNVSIRFRQAFIIFAFIVPIVILGYHLGNEFYKNIAFAKLEIKGIHYERPILRLLNEIADFQIAAYENNLGNADAEKNMQEGIVTIEALFSELTNVHQVIGFDLGITEENLRKNKCLNSMPIAIYKAWQAIKQNPLEESLYFDILNNLSMLVTQVGNNSNMMLDPELDSFSLANLSVQILPQTLQKLADIKSYILINLSKNNNQL